MILEIDDSKTVGDLQERFTSCFPFLKIEFCRNKHQWEDLCPMEEILPADKLIGSIRKIHAPGILEIKSWNKIGEVEKTFYKNFGLNAQIFFKSGSRWIQTGISDNLTIRALRMNVVDYQTILL